MFKITQDDITKTLYKHKGKWLTIYEIAALVNLSDTTVSRQINRMHHWKELDMRPRFKMAGNGARRTIREYRLVI